ncbi:MAG: hypothetical protein HXM12_02825 [Fusobacterium periodonticum]|nr:hypothetical protein [Fusobacterium periodonticum]
MVNVSYFYDEIDLKNYQVDFKQSLTRAFLDSVKQKQELVLAVHSLDDLTGPYLTDLFTEDAMKKLKKEKVILVSYNGQYIKLKVITEKVSVSGNQLNILACFISGNFLIKLAKQYSLSHINWIPWTPEDIQAASKDIKLIKK